jgi:hypothetical protein
MMRDEHKNTQPSKVLVAVRLHRPSTGSYLDLSIPAVQLDFLDEMYPGWVRV